MTLAPEAAARFVRLAEEHLPEVVRIEQEAYPEPWTVGMFRQEIESNLSHFYVMELGDELVGYGGFWLVLDEAHVTSVTIKNSQRRKGLGRALMTFLLDKAREAEARIATLEVRVSNVRARSLYESLGFQSVGLRKGYYPKTNEDAVVMLKELGISASCG
ncbi:MAG TPA: ribosomal protein S18-alanine N-acetyltransferase [Candidatus Hydrogenedentes bacterium]|nr:ribosomal protein S18-alanine N-acetyltransferase [Candidatus Hydrogenedentota bacterium]